jgi:signal transduction histidine kinase
MAPVEKVRADMNPRHALVLSIALLLVAFAIDLATPQALVAAILLTIPVALSSLVLNRRITEGLIVAALVANGVAGYFNGVSEGHTWNAVAIINRVLAGFSIVLVGWLGIMAQSRAVRSGQLAEQSMQAQREQALRRSMETIRSSLNVELVARAIVREAVAALGVDGARLYTIEEHRLAATTFSWQCGGEDVEVSSARPTAELLSLLQAVMSQRRSLVVTPADALGRFALATLGAERAILVPLINDQITFGILLLTMTEAEANPEIEQWVQAFADQATVAAAQASLFVQLADRNAALQQAIEKVEHRGEVIRDLVYALSHDLRTPLTAAAVTLQQALNGSYGPLPEAYREILRRSLAANDELRRLAETLLLVARYESGEQSKDRERLRVLPMVAGVVAELEPICRMRRLSCTASGSDDAFVLGDEGELRRAVMNLLANAINWTPEGGEIRALVQRSGDDRVLIRVEDSGYGVPDERRDQLFQRLEAHDYPRRGAGSGLGLYIARRIAESHGGTARYERNLPTGSVFILDLPAVKEQTTAGGVSMLLEAQHVVPAAPSSG